jgi:hypothetical protein
VYALVVRWWTPLFVLLVHLPGCEKKETPAPTAESARPPPVPVDRLLANELVEGKDKAFGLVLPKQVTISSQFKDMVVAQGEVQPDAVANYVRARVTDGKAVVGASQTLFEGVKAKSEPSRPLHISVTSQAGGRFTRVVVRDITPPPDLPGTPAEKLRSMGLAPDGKLLDPKHLE